MRFEELKTPILENVIDPEDVDAVASQADETNIDPLLKKSLTKIAKGIKLNVDELTIVVATFKGILSNENMQDVARSIRLMRRYYK